MAGRSDLDAFDPGLRTLARILPNAYGVNHTLAPQRALMRMAGAVGRMRGIPEHTVAPGVTVRVHRPVHVADPMPAVLWIHGGGTVMGTAAQEDRFCHKLANFTDAAVVAVDHRLAPEHPYPAPVGDCHAALTWLRSQPWVDADRVAIGGASAGGGLTAALTQMVADRGEPAPCLQMLVYPMLDDRTGAGTADSGPRRMWSPADNQAAWRHYLAGADPAVAAPARRADLSGLAPAWIGVGARDLFVDECRVYARRLTEAGVPTHLEVVPGAFHAFDLIAANAAVSQRFFAAQTRALRDAFAGGAAQLPSEPASTTSGEPLATS